MTSQKTRARRSSRCTRIEMLESRAMMASDVLCFHNIENPEDTDGSGDVTPLDALIVINQLNNRTVADTTSDTSMTDVNADAGTSPLDALIVINYLNRRAADSISVQSSFVSAANRIAGIEKSIASGSLSSRFSLDDAIAVLATLKNGRLPELGDSVSNTGVLHTQVGTLCSDSLVDSAQIVAKITSKLQSASVSEETIDTIASEMTAAITAGNPITFTQVKLRLTELGVDVATLFPEKRSSDFASDRFLASLTRKLTKAGVSEIIIETITTEINTAKESGTALTIAQVKTRLTELGVDVATLFPEKHSSHIASDRFLASLTRKLTRAGVSETIIETITNEINAAKESGTSLTIAQIKTRLTELGGDVSELEFSKLRRGGRSRH